MKITRKQLSELIIEEIEVIENAPAIDDQADPFAKIVEFDDWNDTGDKKGISKFALGFGIGEAILMQALVALANYIAPEIIDYIKGELIDKGVDYAHKLLAYKVFELLVNDTSFKVGKISPLRLFHSIESLRVDNELLKQLNTDQIEIFKLNVKNEIMNSNDHPFKIDVKQILTKLLNNEQAQMLNPSLGQLSEARMIKLAGIIK